MQRAALPETMSAAVLTGPRTFEIREVPIPEPGPGEVLIRMHGCGLCGSNIPPWEGRSWFRYPLEPGAPGHEGWGCVVGLGPGVRGVSPGERVAAITYNAFAEYDRAPVDALVRLPASLQAEDLPGEPLACAMNVLRRSDIRPGHRVAVVGVGFLGAVLVQMAVRSGARVFAISRRGSALELAEKLGAEQVEPLGDDDGALVEKVMTWTGGRGCDRAIEAAGVQRTLDLAGKLVRVRGRLVIAGFHQDGPRVVDMQDWNWRGIDVINAHERDPDVYVEGMRAAIDALASGLLHLDGLITHRMPLSDISEAFRLLEQRPEGFVKAEVLL